MSSLPSAEEIREAKQKENALAAELMPRIANRDPAAVKAFFDVFYPQILQMATIAVKSTKSSANIEDVSQDVALSILTTRHLWKPSGDIHAWLGTMVNNRVRDFHRRAKTSRGGVSLEQELPDGTTLYDILPSQQSPVVDQVSARMELDAIDKTINNAKKRLMTKAQKQIFWLNAEGYSSEEIQQLTGTKIGTIKQNVARSREKLRDEGHGL